MGGCHAMRANGRIPRTTKLLSATGRRCWYCGLKLTKKTMTKDHVIPRVDGGRDALANLVACCKACNAAKGRMDLEEYRDRCNRGGFFHGELHGQDRDA